MTKNQFRTVAVALALIALGPVAGGLVGNGLLAVGVGLIVRIAW